MIIPVYTVREIIELPTGGVTHANMASSFSLKRGSAKRKIDTENKATEITTTKIIQRILENPREIKAAEMGGRAVMTQTPADTNVG